MVAAPRKAGELPRRPCPSVLTTSSVGRPPTVRTSATSAAQPGSKPVAYVAMRSAGTSGGAHKGSANALPRAPAVGGRRRGELDDRALDSPAAALRPRGVGTRLHDDVARRRGHVEELADQARLAHAHLPDDARTRERSRFGPPRLEPREVVAPSDEWQRPDRTLALPPGGQAPYASPPSL